jgi:hypothetical protein
MSEEPRADRAWVRIGTGLSPAALVAFCQDAERLLRINSMYELEQWRPEGTGRFFMQVRNLSNGHYLATQLQVEPRADGMRIAYASGLKTATEFRAEPAGPDDKLVSGGGAMLVVIDDYSGAPEAERQARAGEIDKSLVWWGHDLHRYLKHWVRWSRFRSWRWYMRRIWQPMKPKARRIAFMLIAITVFELVVGILAIVIFVLDWDKVARAALGGPE